MLAGRLIAARGHVSRVLQIARRSQPTHSPVRTLVLPQETVERLEREWDELLPTPEIREYAKRWAA